MIAWAEDAPGVVRVIVFEDGEYIKDIRIEIIDRNSPTGESSVFYYDLEGYYVEEITFNPPIKQAVSPELFYSSTVAFEFSIGQFEKVTSL